MLLTSIAWALAGFALGALLVLTVLRWERIVSWFQGYKNRHTKEDVDAVGFTVSERLSSGNYKTVQGVFNKKTNKVVEAVGYESKERDAQIEEYHEDEELVIYE